jgi:hypothetical protein
MKKKGEQMKTEGIFHDRAKPVLEVETDTAYQSVRTTRRLSPCGGGADRSLKILAHLHMLLFRCASMHATRVTGVPQRPLHVATRAPVINA